MTKVIAKPYVVTRERFEKRTYYIIISSNYYTYHHDGKFRYRRLKDERKYIFKNRRNARRVCSGLNKS